MQDIEAFVRAIAPVIDGEGDAARLIDAVSYLFPNEAGFCVINRKGQNPLYLADTYASGTAKAAVQLYVTKTYLLNPVHAALFDGLKSGVHRMADLAPDNWVATTADVVADESEEIGFRTPGWPEGLQEVAILAELGEDEVGEVSLARPAVSGGIPNADLEPLHMYLPLIRSAFLSLHKAKSEQGGMSAKPLTDFGKDSLTHREAEVVQMILKGHSSASIAAHLAIALPTVKSHRKNAYAKLGISTQQQLFSAFLNWQ